MNSDFFHSPRFWSTLPLAVLAVLVLWFVVRQGAALSRFFSETGAELKKCSWPWNPAEHGMKRYRELIESTVVVAISALLLAGFVTSSDFILVKVIGSITRLH